MSSTPLPPAEEKDPSPRDPVPVDPVPLDPVPLDSNALLTGQGHYGQQGATEDYPIVIDGESINDDDDDDGDRQWQTRSDDPNYRVNRNGDPVESCAVTWSHVAESDRSAQSVGEKGTALDYEDLKDLQQHFPDSEFIDMTSNGPSGFVPAGVLVVRNYFDNAIFHELLSVKPEYVDRHMWSYGKCKNKNARWNTNMTDAAAEGDIPNPDPKHRHSSQIPFREYPAANRARAKLTVLGEKAGLNLSDLKMEVNYYFPKGFIGRHGDIERNLVIGGSVGTNDRVIQWCEYYHNQPGKIYQVVLHPGDMYIMCGKASGADWKKSSILTFRHCAGSQAYVDKVTADAIKKTIKKTEKRAAASAAAPVPKRRKTDRGHCQAHTGAEDDAWAGHARRVDAALWRPSPRVNLV